MKEILATTTPRSSRTLAAFADGSCVASIDPAADGSRLCFMGLPTPNIFAGEHNFHSRLEWVSAEDMELAAKVIVELAKVWEERA
jgi:tripeptide aminopeptidase